MSRVLVNQATLQLALNALRRDAEAGRPVRGEIAAELERAALPVPEPIAWWDCAAPNGLRWAAKGTPPTANDFEVGSPVVVLPILKNRNPEEH